MPCVYIGDELARYGFGEGHPFGPDRLGAFWQQASATGLDRQVRQCAPVSVERPEFIPFQCGADSIAGDPITHLRHGRSRGFCSHAPDRSAIIQCRPEAGYFQSTS